MKFEVYLLPLLPPLVVLAVDALGRASVGARSTFWLITATTGLAAALAAGVFLPEALGGRRTALPTVVVLAFGLAALVVVRRAAAGVTLLAAVLAVSAATLVAWWTIVPTANALLSPRDMGERLGRRAAEGYAPAVYKMYPGRYPYHAGRVVFETRDAAELDAFLAREERVAVVVPEKHRAAVLARHPRLVVDHTQRFLDEPDWLLVAPAPPGPGPPTPAVPSPR
jgi:hypothetical protein